MCIIGERSIALQFVLSARFYASSVIRHLNVSCMTCAHFFLGETMFDISFIWISPDSTSFSVSALRLIPHFSANDHTKDPFSLCYNKEASVTYFLLYAVQR